MMAAPPLFDPALMRAIGAALSIILLAGAWQKLRDMAVFQASLENYRLLPDPLLTPMARLLPLWELSAGTLLLFPAWQHAGGAATAALLAVVTAAVAINLLRGHTNIDCGCGGLTPHIGEQTLNWGLVVRNLVLVSAAMVITLGVETARDIVWIDYLSVAGGTLGLTGLYVAANQLLANQPRLQALKNR